MQPEGDARRLTQKKRLRTARSKYCSAGRTRNRSWDERDRRHTQPALGPSQPSAHFVTPQGKGVVIEPHVVACEPPANRALQV
jgi:hypothetical protein